MNKLKRILVLLMILAMLSGLCACATTNTTAATTATTVGTGTAAPTTAGTTAPTTSATLAAPATITLLMSGDNTPPATNSVLTEIRKRTNINLVVTYVKGADYNTKLSALLAANTLTDLLTYGIADGEEFRDNRIILELTELLTKYGPNVLKDQGDALFTGLNSKKNGVWGLYSGFGAPTSFAVRTDWLKNVGLAMPTNLDSLYEVLKAFTNNDPNKNEKKDTIGIGMSGTTGFHYIFGAFGIPFTRNIQLADGTVTTYMKHPQYLEAIKYLRKLYQEGLMEPEFATIPVMSCYEKLWSGVYGCFDFGAGGTTNNWLSRYTETPKPTFDYTVIAGPGGQGGTPAYRVTTYLGISAGCKNPAAAMSLINYLVTKEGNELLRLGIEGVHFKWNNESNGEKTLIKPYDDAAVNRNDGVFVYWGPFAARLMANNAALREYNAQTRAAVLLAEKYPIAEAFVFGALNVNKEYGETLTTITKEAMAQLIVSTGDIEKEYQAFVKRWMVEGGSQFEKEATEVYKKENAK